MKDKIVHKLIPEHTIVSNKDEILKKFRVTVQGLPKISMKDPAIQHLDAKPGDVIEIKRSSKTAGDTIFYRGVVNE